MRKVYFLLLLISVTAMAAPPAIQNPTPLVVCDDNDDGIAEFNLSSKNPEILGSLNPSSYFIYYYETLTAAQNDTNNVYPYAYNNITPSSQTVYARVIEIGNPSNFAITSLQLNVNPLPVAGHVPDMVVYEDPYDGFASFDLASNDSMILNGQTGMFITYYVTQADATVGANPIATATAFVNNSNPQTIWVSLVNPSTGCNRIIHFNLAVVPVGNIYFPDPNFKAGIIASGVDTNADGEIQLTEAATVTALYTDNLGITDVTGIRYFPALQTLKFRDNAVSGILDLSGLSNLTYLDFVNNQVTGLNLTGANNLLTLIGQGNRLSSLDFSMMPNLQELKISYNNFTTLDISSLTHLQVLESYFNNMTSLNIGNLSELTTLYCMNNHLTSIDLSGASGLLYLVASNNNLTTLDLSGQNQLSSVSVPYNQLTSINFNNNTHLNDITCSNNNLAALDLSSLTALDNLNCSNNQLTTLDFTHNQHFHYLSCFANQLVTIFLKNGSTEDFDPVNWSENPTLQYICADESQIDSLQTAVGPTVSVNSYCTFSPGGIHNTINGTAHFDGDNNGCDALDVTPPFIRISINDGTTTGTTFTDIDSSYTFYTGAGDYTITPQLENPSFFNVGAPLTVNFPAVDNSVSNQHFCITPVGVHPDIEVAISPIVRARPGFEATYEIVFRNIGNQVMSQANGISFTYDAAKMDFLSADAIPASVGSGTVSWDFANLAPFESRKIYVVMQVHTPTDVNPVNLGDVLTFNATINPVSGDENPSDNTFQYNQIVVGSFDPNEIICLEGNVVSPVEIGNYLHYAINFENTGTAEAENIVVREVIDTTQFDVNSLQLLNSSASVTTRLTGNVVEFMFPSINLHSGGHGNILLKIRSNNTLVEGDMVSKKANIYFDYNLPVETVPENTLFQSLKNPDIPVDASISVYPNPTYGTVNISCDNTIKSVQLYDIQGRVLQTSLVNENQATLDVSTQSGGVYFIKIISDKGMGVKKIVRE